jgi:glucose/arabinose dehydrogenase
VTGTSNSATRNRAPRTGVTLTGALPASVLPASGEIGPGVPAFAVRPGYRVTLVAENIDNLRFMEFDDKGTLYVSQPGRGAIVTLRPGTDGKYTQAAEFVTGRQRVHGMSFHNGWLWFAQSGAIHRGRDTNNDGKADEVVTVLTDEQLPSGGGHWWRSLLVTDQHIFTSIGDSGNITDQRDTDRQKVWRYNLDGSGKTLWASGIRNTEKLRLRPGTSEVWGADHDSDEFGARLREGKKNPNTRYDPLTDVMPPCEFNHYEEGKFYGHPFVVGNRIPRLEFYDRPDILELIANTTPPAWSLGAHWAPNGWTFLSKNYFPGHQGDAFIACHGSWNASAPAGYRIERVLFDPATQRPYGAQAVVSTVGSNGEVLDRPVDCVEAPDGTVLFSCDSRRIFRISRAGAIAR